MRASAPTVGQDEWEYAALNDAARTSGSLLTAVESRRIVAAADVSSNLVGPAALADNTGDTVATEDRDETEESDETDGSVVSISDTVALKRIASFHIDGGDDDQDSGLLWYDVTELPVVLDLL